MSCLVYLLKLPKMNLFQSIIPIWVKRVYHWHKPTELLGFFSVENVAVLKEIYKKQLIAIIFIVVISDIVLVIHSVQLNKLFFSLLV